VAPQWKGAYFRRPKMTFVRTSYGNCLIQARLGMEAYRQGLRGGLRLLSLEQVLGNQTLQNLEQSLRQSRLDRTRQFGNVVRNVGVSSGRDATDEDLGVTSTIGLLGVGG